MKIVIYIALPFLLLGCDMLDQSGATRRDLLAQRGPNSLRAFSQYVHPLAKDQCMSCHEQQTPRFAVRDRDKAYDRMFKLIDDWHALKDSRLARRKLDKHCGMACTNNRDLLRALEAWHQGLEEDKIAPPDERIFTSEVVLEETPGSGTLPNDRFVDVSFPLTSINSDFDAELILEVQQYQSTNTYRIRKPRIRTQNVNLFIRSLKPRINGSHNPADNQWVSIQAAIAANNGANPPLLSPFFMLIEMDLGIGIDKLSFEIGEIKTIDAVACQRLDVFRTTVLPYMRAANKCFECHTTAHPRWPMQTLFNISEQALCNSAVQRANLKDPESSAIFNPFGGYNGHPRNRNGVIIMNAQDKATIIDWINAEAAAGSGS